MSEARKEQWKAIDSSERSARMSRLASLRWSRINSEDRREYAMKLVKARQKMPLEVVEHAQEDISITEK